MKVGDLFLGLLIDPSGDLKTQVTKAAKEAGDAGGQTLGLSMSTALRGASVAIGAGLAIATRGALEAEAAQGKFMAATGKSREEAKKFVSGMDSLAGSAGAVGRSFADIAATGTMVEQQFGTTGQKTVDLTGKILEYARVTGQDATQAAADLEDTLSAFNLTADDAVPTMDRLIASSQKYGTDAGPAAVAALNDMAPALTAMDMGLDDGIELLNAFEVAGGDAGTAASGLNRAIKSLKPGEDLDDLIAQIAAIEDPILKAQEATRIFGKAAGPEMAKLIKPGMTSLDEFGISAEEAAGKTGKAADDMLTFSARIRGWAEKALAGAREVGQEFGPALTGLASLGTLAAPFAKGLGGLFTGLLRHAGILGAATAVGTATGGAQAAGHEAAATGPGAIRALAARIAAMSIPLAAAGTTVGTAVGTAMAAGMAGVALTGGAVVGKTLIEGASDALGDPVNLRGMQAQFGNMRYALQPAATEVGTAAGETVLTTAAAVMTAAARWQRYAATWGAVVTGGLTPAAEEAGEATVRSYTDAALQELVRQKAATAQAFYEHVHEAMLAAHREAAWGGAQTPGEFSQGLRSSFDNVSSAFDDLRQLMKDTLDPAQQEAELIGIATSKRLAKALADGRPEVRSEAQQIALDAIDRLHALDATSPEIGRLTTLLLARALPNERPALQDAINQIVTTVTTPLGRLPGIAENAGEDIGVAFAQGLRNKFGSVTTAVENMAGIVRGRLELGSPAREGPWSKNGGPTAWMFDAGHKMTAALQAGLNGFVSPPMLGMPSLAGLAPSPGFATGTGTNFGDISITVNAPGGDGPTVRDAVLSALGEVLTGGTRVRYTTRTA